MGTISAEQVKEAIDNFSFQGTYVEEMSWGNGHINDTYLLIFAGENNEGECDVSDWDLF